MDEQAKPPAKGIVQGEAEGKPAAAPEPSARGGKLTPDAMRKGMNVPPNLTNAYERVLVAGKKVMYSEQTHELMLKQWQSGGPAEQRLGEGIGGLLLLLMQQSNGTIPPQVLIPVGVELLAEAAAFINESGQEEVSDEQIGGAMVVMVQMVLEKFGVDPNNIEGALQQAGANGGAA